jgi:putative FmdB family regulatory protein
MPAYDYRCEREGVFELTLPLGTAPSTAGCPECGRAEAPRMFAAPLTTAPRPGPAGAGRAPAAPGGPRPSLSQLPLTAPLRGGLPRP